MYDSNHSLPVNLVIVGDALSGAAGNVAVVYDKIASRH